MAAPTAPSGLLRTIHINVCKALPPVAAQPLRNLTVLSDSGAADDFCRASRVLDPGVEPAIGQVHEQVDERKAHGYEQDAGLSNGIVTLQ